MTSSGAAKIGSEIGFGTSGTEREEREAGASGKALGTSPQERVGTAEVRVTPPSVREQLKQAAAELGTASVFVKPVQFVCV